MLLPIVTVSVVPPRLNEMLQAGRPGRSAHVDNPLSTPSRPGWPRGACAPSSRRPQRGLRPSASSGSCAPSSPSAPGGGLLSVLPVGPGGGFALRPRRRRRRGPRSPAGLALQRGRRGSRPRGPARLGRLEALASLEGLPVRPPMGRPLAAPGGVALQDVVTVYAHEVSL
jgi:hypothetical protein